MARLRLGSARNAERSGGLRRPAVLIATRSVQSPTASVMLDSAGSLTSFGEHPVIDEDCNGEPISEVRQTRDHEPMSKLSRKMRDMHDAEADSCDPAYNRVLIEAACELERLEACLQFLSSNADSERDRNYARAAVA